MGCRHAREVECIPTSPPSVPLILFMSFIRTGPVAAHVTEACAPLLATLIPLHIGAQLHIPLHAFQESEALKKHRILPHLGWLCEEVFGQLVRQGALEVGDVDRDAFHCTPHACISWVS